MLIESVNSIIYSVAAWGLLINCAPVIVSTSLYSKCHRGHSLITYIILRSWKTWADINFHMHWSALLHQGCTSGVAYTRSAHWGATAWQHGGGGTIITSSFPLPFLLHLKFFLATRGGGRTCNYTPEGHQEGHWQHGEGVTVLLHGLFSLFLFTFIIFFTIRSGGGRDIPQEYATIHYWLPINLGLCGTLQTFFRKKVNNYLSFWISYYQTFFIAPLSLFLLLHISWYLRKSKRGIQNVFLLLTYVIPF